MFEVLTLTTKVIEKLNFYIVVNFKAKYYNNMNKGSKYSETTWNMEFGDNYRTYMAVFLPWAIRFHLGFIWCSCNILKLKYSKIFPFYSYEPLRLTYISLLVVVLMIFF